MRDYRLPWYLRQISSIAKPGSARALRWGTSSPFVMQWNSRTEVHFRNTAHLKNEFNLDESGSPHPVSVGYDGQEISPAAGRDLCEIMDDFMMGKEGRR